jgi:hypothetical protein
MLTKPRKAKKTTIAVGVAVLAGILLAIGPFWMVDVTGEPDSLVEGETTTETTGSSSWTVPERRSRDRTGRPLLELVGVFISPGDAIAMIREKDGALGVYRVGDQVVDSRVLVEIQESHVLLRNMGRIERLRLLDRNPRRFADAQAMREFAESLIRPPEVADESSPD